MKQETPLVCKLLIYLKQETPFVCKLLIYLKQEIPLVCKLLIYLKHETPLVCKLLIYLKHKTPLVCKLLIYLKQETPLVCKFYLNDWSSTNSCSLWWWKIQYGQYHRILPIGQVYWGCVYFFLSLLLWNLDMTIWTCQKSHSNELLNRIERRLGSL
jgi:hypothetical protein